MSQADYKKEMTSLIVTIFNEVASLPDFLQSVVEQSVLPDELIIVDSQSEDNSQAIIKEFIAKNKLPTTLIIQKSTRSVGRNLAAKKAKGQWLAISDAGLTLDRHWLRELLKKQHSSQARVVAGYYQSAAKTPLAKAIAPYFMVTPERFDEKTFLPATRSMLIEKKLWDELGGLDESLDYAEDYPLAKKIQAQGFKIAVAQKALVNWLPPDNLMAFVKTIFATAQYDVIARVTRPKMYLVFLRYLIFFAILLFFPNYVLIISLMIFYVLWSIRKNFRSAGRACFYLPLLQVLADWAVMLGSLVGLVSRQSRQ